ncbi:MAG: tetratricopeptide repeat protein [Desulfarculus sp.]|nr:tetratricopeptide repeat protein [Desulfarculus sp.]
MPTPSLGLVMILKNEAANLPRSLAPIAHCFDEVVVADTGSQDETVSICKQLGARVFSIAWQHDFAAARNHSIAQARADWLLWLDGDNATTPREIEALRAVIPLSGPAVVWAQEKVVPSGERLWQKRCFPRRAEVWFSGRVHEQLVHPPEWPNLVAPMVIEHWGYADPRRTREKGAYYLSLLEQTLQETPDDYYARFQVGRCLINLADWSGAVAQLSRVTADDGARRGNPELWAAAHHLLAQSWQRLGRQDLARNVLEQLLHQMPEHGLSHYHRGRLAYASGKWQEAVEHLSQGLSLGWGAPVVDLDPIQTTFLAHYFLARACEELGRHHQALEHLQAARKSDPRRASLATDQARLLLAIGKPQAARKELEQILNKTPGDRRARALWQQIEASA